MTSRPWMPFYPADYRKDTGHLSAEQHGAYFLLVLHYWATGGLPDDDAQLARIACLSVPAWRKHKPIISRFFHDGWRHKRIDAELAKAAEISSKRRTSALQKQSKSSANAQQKHTQSQPQSQSQSQKEHGEHRAVANDLADAIGRLCGHSTPHDWPPAFLGAPARIEAWLRNGWPRESILDAVKETLAKKRDGPPENVSYFEKPIAKFIERSNAPLPKYEAHNGPDRQQYRPNSALDAVRELRAEIERGTDYAEDRDVVVRLPAR